MPNIYTEHNDERVKQVFELSKKRFCTCCGIYDVFNVC